VVLKLLAGRLMMSNWFWLLVSWHDPEKNPMRCAADTSGEDNLVCMTRNFDLVHEEPLRQEDFGEGQLRDAPKLDAWAFS
jgi:hypothetical protein